MAIPFSPCRRITDAQRSSRGGGGRPPPLNRAARCCCVVIDDGKTATQRRGRGQRFCFVVPSPLPPTFLLSLARTALSNDDDGIGSTEGVVTRVARARNVGRIDITEKVEGLRGRGDGVLRSMSCAVGRPFLLLRFSVCVCRSRGRREEKGEEEGGRQAGSCHGTVLWSLFMSLGVALGWTCRPRPHGLVLGRVVGGSPFLYTKE
ncbi:hypothetical protein CH063_08624 [Colletotrichum higginsianum]|uniref:Uncharacterized protein n=1 Tax=Colletotrichum higginsianum (strain IMI 349063) TaxID=759273 RepID=H1VAI9_COLHI|nr:hypothetical protein CH063_08624 [Colletotrichum higginsianum]